MKNKTNKGKFLIASSLFILLAPFACSQDDPEKVEPALEEIKMVKANVGGYLITQREKVDESHKT